MKVPPATASPKNGQGSIQPIATELGVFEAHYSERGLVALDFPSNRNRNGNKRLKTTSRSADGWHQLTCEALKAVIAGGVPRELPPLDWSGASTFQKRVWKALLAIRPGQTRSYGDLAKMVGKSGAARAVGTACGSNPIPVLVPCHRVMAAGGGLGGFSAGLDWKRRLLERERVAWKE